MKLSGEALSYHVDDLNNFNPKDDGEIQSSIPVAFRMSIFVVVVKQVVDETTLCVGIRKCFPLVLQLF